MPVQVSVVLFCKMRLLREQSQAAHLQLTMQPPDSAKEIIWVCGRKIVARFVGPRVKLEASMIEFLMKMSPFRNLLPQQEVVTIYFALNQNCIL